MATTHSVVDTSQYNNWLDDLCSRPPTNKDCPECGCNGRETIFGRLTVVGGVGWGGESAQNHQQKGGRVIKQWGECYGPNGENGYIYCSKAVEPLPEEFGRTYCTEAGPGNKYTDVKVEAGKTTLAPSFYTQSMFAPTGDWVYAGPNGYLAMEWMPSSCPPKGSCAANKAMWETAYGASEQNYGNQYHVSTTPIDDAANVYSSKTAWLNEYGGEDSSYGQWGETTCGCAAGVGKS